MSDDTAPVLPGAAGISEKRGDAPVARRRRSAEKLEQPFVGLRLRRWPGFSRQQRGFTDMTIAPLGLRAAQ